MQHQPIYEIAIICHHSKKYENKACSLAFLFREKLLKDSQLKFFTQNRLWLQVYSKSMCFLFKTRVVPSY